MDKHESYKATLEEVMSYINSDVQDLTQNMYYYTRIFEMCNSDRLQRSSSPLRSYIDPSPNKRLVLTLLNEILDKSDENSWSEGQLKRFKSIFGSLIAKYRDEKEADLKPLYPEILVGEKVTTQPPFEAPIR